MNNIDYLILSQKIAESISNHLYDNLRKYGYLGESLTDRSDLKSAHHIDKITGQIAKDILGNYNCNIFVESLSRAYDPNADFSVYIDPIDGSLNWERGVGDPCVVVAISKLPIIKTISDLTFSYVYGLRSGNLYYTNGDHSYYQLDSESPAVNIFCDKYKSIAESTLYLRPGYGFAKKQLESTLPLFYMARDIRAFDNAGMEFCEIARNAADAMIEARNGSDCFNLLAYPILRNAGGCLLDLGGNDFSSIPINVAGKYDYIACNNKTLASEIATIIKSQTTT